MANKKTAKKGVATKEPKGKGFSPMDILNEFKNPAIIIAGLTVGNFAGKKLNSVLKVDETATGFQVKAMIKPIVQLSTGIGGACYLKNPYAKLFASGVAASGIASTVKVFLKKDILQGFSDVAGLGEVPNRVQEVFREPINLQIEPYNPNLPELHGGDNDTKIEGIVKVLDESEEISGTELGEYIEVKDVQIL